jgi:3-hydroxybutyryl-CoA dehydrogenase
MGPFKLMDLIGNDVNYAVSCSVWEQLGKPRRLLPSGIQKEKVENGELGKKTGKGYYDYSPQK